MRPQQKISDESSRAGEPERHPLQTDRPRRDSSRKGGSEPRCEATFGHDDRKSTTAAGDDIFQDRLAVHQGTEWLRDGADLRSRRRRSKSDLRRRQKRSSRESGSVHSQRHDFRYVRGDLGARPSGTRARYKRQPKAKNILQTSRTRRRPPLSGTSGSQQSRHVSTERPGQDAREPSRANADQQDVV